MRRYIQAWIVNAPRRAVLKDLSEESEWLGRALGGVDLTVGSVRLLRTSTPGVHCLLAGHTHFLHLSFGLENTNTNQSAVDTTWGPHIGTPVRWIKFRYVWVLNCVAPEAVVVVVVHPKLNPCGPPGAYTGQRAKTLV